MLGMPVAELTLDICTAHQSSDDWILGEAFEVAPAPWITVEIDRGAHEQLSALQLAFLAYLRTNTLDQSRVEGGRETRGIGEHCRRWTIMRELASTSCASARPRPRRRHPYRQDHPRL